MINKHPAKWTEQESYEAAFLARITCQDLKIDSRVRGCFDCMPRAYRDDPSLKNLRSAFIRGWIDAE